MSAIQSLLGPLGAVYLIGALAIALILLGTWMGLTQRADPLDRLRAEREGGGRRADLATPASAHPARLRQDTSEDKLQKFSSFLEPQDEGELSSMRLQLMRAGYRGRDAVRIFKGVQMVAGLGLLGLGTLYALLQQAGGAELGAQQLGTYVLMPGLVGYMGPRHFVSKRVAAREAEIMQGFPDSLDLMLVCIEAGQSLDQSIMRVAGEMKDSYPALALEYQTVAHQMKAGMDKGQVFRDMAERCGVPDISSFTTVLIQSQSFGTPISEALKVYSDEMRDKRIMRAEEKANTLPTKMTLATMMFTLPPLMIILLAPSIYAITQSFGGN